MSGEAVDAWLQTESCVPVAVWPRYDVASFRVGPSFAGLHAKSVCAWRPGEWQLERRSASPVAFARGALRLALLGVLLLARARCGGGAQPRRVGHPIGGGAD